MSKYEPLWKYLKNKNETVLTMSFEEIGAILDFELDHSFLAYKKEASQFGYEVEKISLKNRIVVFRKI